MDRREFVKTGAAGAAAAAIPFGSPSGPAKPLEKHDFKLKYAPHFGMFKNLAGEDLVDQLKFMADTGFTAFEDNTMARRPVEEQERIASAMGNLGLEMGVFVVNLGNGFGKTTFSSGDEALAEEFLTYCRESVDVAKRVNAKWMTVVMGDLTHKLEMDYQTANAIDLLRRGAEIFEPHDLVMVLEPLNPWTNHPDMFLSKIPQANMICKAVDSPSCKILFDIYHQQITEGNLIPNMDMSWDQIAYFQIGDNPGRKEPTTGEINYRNVFEHIHSKGWTGIMGMEHGNSKPGAEGEQAVIDAYTWSDDF